LDARLHRFLAASRRVVFAAPLEPLYRANYETIKTLLPKRAQVPELIAVRTPASNAEVVTLRNTSYLVYDQYLGQCFNYFNRIFFTGDTSRIIPQSYKYLAELLVADNRLSEAVILATAHATHHKKWPLTEGEASSMPRRAVFTWLQELYVTAHECGHFLFRTQPKAFRGFVELGDEAAVIQLSIPDDILAAGLQRKYPEMTGDEIAHAVQSQRAFRETHATSTNLREELACDVFAIIAVMSARETRLNSVTDAEAGLAIKLAMRHLRLLLIIEQNRLVFRPDAPDAGEEAWRLHRPVVSLLETIVRNSAADVTIRGHIAVERQPLFVTQTEELSTKYAKLLDDPVLFELPSILIGLGHALQPKWPIRFRPGSEDLVDEITGWSYDEKREAAFTTVSDLLT
jgi:hypothetical protein